MKTEKPQILLALGQKRVQIMIALDDSAPKMQLDTAGSTAIVNQFRKGLIKRVQ